MITDKTNVPQEGTPQLATIDANGPISIRIASEENTITYEGDGTQDLDILDDEEMQDDCDEDAWEEDSADGGEDEGPRLPNKFKYPEFSGPQGKKLLYNIVKQICTSAMYDTWRSYVAYQVDGNDCYVGVQRLYRDMSLLCNLCERTIRWRWQCFQERSLVRFYDKVVEVEELQDDGFISKRVEIHHVKDFEALYDLAYTFYQWRRSSSYIAPLRENAAAIRSNRELALWLATNFECYRRILVPETRGRKRQERPCYQEEITRQIDTAIAGDVSNTTVWKSFSKSFSKSFALNTKNESPNVDTDRDITNGVASSAEPGVVGAAGAQAIGSTGTQTNTYRSDKVTKERTTKRDPQTRNIENIEESEKAPATATPAPVLTENKENIENAGRRELPTACRDQIEQMEARTPEKLIAQIVPVLQRLLNDQASEAFVKHTLTKFFKDRAVFDPKVIKRAVILALTQAYALPDEKVRKRNVDGSANWMPKFYTALDHVWSLAAFLHPEAENAETEKASVEDVPIEEEPLEQQEQPVVQEEERQEQLPLDLDRLHVDQLLNVLASFDEVLSKDEQALIEQGDPQMIATLRERAWQLIVDDETNLRYDGALREALKLLKPLTRSVEVIPIQSHDACGSPIGYRAQNGQCYCVLCDPSWQWGLSTRKEIKAIVQRIPSRVTIQDEVMTDIPFPQQNIFHPEDQS